MEADRASGKSRLDRSQEKATLRDVTPGLIGLVVLEAVVASMDLDADSNRWHLAIALSPLLPALWLVRAQFRGLRRSDEYQRVVQLEAMSVGFGVAMVVAMTGGMLDAADVGSTAQFLQLTFITGILAWVAALAVRSRR